jgi:flagellar hook-associated protein 1 FlgK
MSGNLLSIGKTGLFAAQAGLSTTGHNITNANVAGYNRQVVVQSTATSLNTGVGFIGTGTQIAQIKRYSDEFLNLQVRNAQASQSGLDAYHAQISQIDNMLADQTSGLSPSLQGFFKGVQDMAANRASIPSRQAMLSSADTLATRFQALDARLGEIRDGVNGNIQTSVTMINSYAQQIADLNDKIGSFASAQQMAPNDMLDKRDQLVMELNKQVKATVTPGDNNSLTISIGSGQPLVVGARTFQLAATQSPTDLTRIEVGYVVGPNKTTVLADNALSGGTLGGVLEFRSKTLDPAQSALGKVAIGLAIEFNAQHKLGLDQNGQPGKDFFNVAQAFVGKNINNAASSDTDVKAAVTDPALLRDSDYRVQHNGSSYDVIRLSDNQPVISNYTPDGNPVSADGIDFMITGSGAAGDNFLVRPTINGAADFKVLAKDVSSIAAAAPIATSAPVGNTGTGKISEGKVDADFLTGPPTLPVTLTYLSAGGGTLDGFPAGLPVRMTDSDGNVTDYPAPATNVLYDNGATYTFGGVSVTMTGVPGNTDTFTISSNTGGIGDTRNIGLLADLQTKNIFNNGSATIQSSYAQLVSTVGNKTREVQVNGEAAEALLTQAKASAADVSGVNLDEEATNLIKYQQAYQAAGKVMQIAGTIFDTLLSIGR